jgi:opacity protein-like surface antigen
MYNFLVHTEPRSVGCLSLYGGAGIGILWVDGGFSNATDDFSVGDSSFAYQFIGGLNYVVGPRVDSYIEYRYLGADYIEVHNDSLGASMGDFGYDSHGVFFGLRFGR